MTASTPGKVLLVTLMDPEGPSGGRELLYRLNAACLTELFGASLLIHRLSKAPPAGPLAIGRGYIDGVTPGAIRTILDLIRSERVEQVFLDGSNLGAIAAGIAVTLPDVRIVSFFHNVEVRFFLGSLKVRRTPKALAILAANYVAERLAVRSSNALVCLSRRDSDGLHRIYGRSADYILPMALEDRCPSPPLPAFAGRDRFLLFVGGDFYANRQGIEWFVRHVAPRVSVITKVVGRGMNALRDRIGDKDRVEIIGEVDDLARSYADCYCVIAPIFDGSGMKTKVAEALMFGKRVIGTSEAFSGYADDARAIGWQSDDADDFVEAIRAALCAGLPVFDTKARAVYEDRYSFPAALRRMACVMNQEECAP